MPLSWGAKNGPAARLDKLLDDRGLSSAQLARELHVDPSTITKYRKGSRVPDANALSYIVRRAGGSADEILGIKPLGSVASRAEVLRRLEVLSAALEDVKKLNAEAEQ